MVPAGFLDTNVILRHIMQDHPEQSPVCTEFFGQIETGAIAVRTLDTVVFESVYTMERLFGMPRLTIAGAMVPLLSFPAIELPSKDAVIEAFPLWVETRRLSFADAYHLVMTRQMGLDRIISFDRGLRGYPGVTRVEPPLE